MRTLVHETSAAPVGAEASTPPFWALWRLLDELAVLVTDMPSSVYLARPVGHVSGTIGEHVRHCLDHVDALVTADPSLRLSYDRRRRGTAVETDAAAAIAEITRLKSALYAWSFRALDEPVLVSSITTPAGDFVEGWSTLGRELASVVSHTIHHQALIGVLLAVHGRTVPDRFGFAPSTPARKAGQRE